MTKLNELKRAQNAQAAERRKRMKELNRIETEAHGRRVAFVKALDPSRAEPFIGPLAVYIMRHSPFNAGATNLKTIEEIIDVDAMLQGDILTNRYATTPAYILLLTFTVFRMTGCYHYYKGYTQEIIHLCSDSLRGEFFAMNDLYDILIALGYEMTDEEQQWRDGSHPAYINKPVEAFLTCL